MAPEVAAGQPYDVSSDIYGLGMVLCRILDFAMSNYDVHQCAYVLCIMQCMDRPPAALHRCSQQFVASNGPVLILIERKSGQWDIRGRSAPTTWRTYFGPLSPHL